MRRAITGYKILYLQGVPTSKLRSSNFIENFIDNDIRYFENRPLCSAFRAYSIAWFTLMAAYGKSSDRVTFRDIILKAMGAVNQEASASVARLLVDYEDPRYIANQIRNAREEIINDALEEAELNIPRELAVNLLTLPLLQSENIPKIRFLLAKSFLRHTRYFFYDPVFNLDCECLFSQDSRISDRARLVGYQTTASDNSAMAKSQNAREARTFILSLDLPDRFNPIYVDTGTIPQAISDKLLLDLDGANVREISTVTEAAMSNPVAAMYAMESRLSSGGCLVTSNERMYSPVLSGCNIIFVSPISRNKFNEICVRQHPKWHILTAKN